MADLPSRSVTELSALLRTGELGAVELTTACLEAIESREGDLRAWTHLDGERALDRAKQLDSLTPAERGPLHGIPAGVKDIIDTADQPTEYGSPIYAGHRPAADAEVVARLRAAGAVIVGKTVTTEFALFRAGPTTNPHDPSRTPGGSSSGSAAAVGAGTLPLALGTQTAGSVVRPASFCGVVGVKPTFDALPTMGVKPCSPALDTVGLFARDVAGAAHALWALTGTAGGSAAQPHAAPLADRARVTVGFARTPEWPRIPESTRSRIVQAVGRVAAAHEVVEVDLPFVGLVEAQAAVMLVEATRSLADERTHHADDLSPILRDILRAGDHAVWSYDAARAYIDACRGRLAELFAPVDVLVAPSVLGEPPPIEEGTGDPLLCRVWTALGTPAVSVPGLTGPDRLPLGVQVIAPPGADGVALTGAYQVAAVLAAPSTA